jgi:hypothetical protein
MNNAIVFTLYGTLSFLDSYCAGRQGLPVSDFLKFVIAYNKNFMNE